MKSLVLFLMIAMTAETTTPKLGKPRRVPLTVVNPGAPVQHWGCRTGYTLWQHEWEMLPTGIMQENTHKSMSDYTLMAEGRRHFFACLDSAIDVWDKSIDMDGK